MKQTEQQKASSNVFICKNVSQSSFHIAFYDSQSRVHKRECHKDVSLFICWPKDSLGHVNDTA